MAATCNPSSQLVKVPCSLVVVVMAALVVVMVAPAAGTSFEPRCQSMYGQLMPCMDYTNFLRGGRNWPSPECCRAIRNLRSTLRGRADRQAACRCLKDLSAGYAAAIDHRLVSSIPRKCGVSLPYVSPNINCNRVA
ncbi:non-specific lipid-transfer protein 1-like [Nymphaea colorata]|uniref:non-specific lipid-transfer protein 1-like n=1 Tax=Nymphaea colorata TaxID=210225 RepID=UPI00129D7D74|nr:non-specific lipid-transfer protein 1-like [Nymphaea colorata]